MKKIIKQLASLKLAVFVILGIATITAVGTFVEARYDMTMAAKLVYKTPWMFGILGLLAINLTAVMVDRWPWKLRHSAFLCAHIGILTLLLGSLITYKYGLDGSLRFGIDQTSNRVILGDTELRVFASFDGQRFQTIFAQEADFFAINPKKNPMVVPMGIEANAQIIDYWPFASAAKQTRASQNPRFGSGVRFQVHNAKVNTSEWLLQTKPTDLASTDFGPASFFLGPWPQVFPQKNALFLRPNGKLGLDYAVTYADPKRKTLKGKVSEGEVIRSGWMDLEIRILRYFPNAEETWEFKQVDRPTPLTTSVIKILWLGKDYFLQLNDLLKIYTDTAAYFVAYSNRAEELSFKLTLKAFHVDRYQGTMRAASYRSIVTVPDGSDVEISMNEPLKHGGYTFYQSSFQDGPDGKPIASILSVNKDPGRFLKYLGSLIIVIGMILLYFNRRKTSRASAPKEGVL